MGRIQRILRFAWVAWFLAVAGDQVLGIYDRLPERTRGWIESVIIGNVAAVLATAGFVVLGVVRGIDLFWLIFAAAVFLVITIWIIRLIQRAVEWLKRGAFEVVPVTASGVQVGPGEDITNPDRIYARIGVTSTRDVGRCVAVVTGISVYERMTMTISPMTKLLWNARYLSWTPDEDRQRQGTLLKDLPMTADLAVISKDDPGYFRITSADSGSRQRFPQGVFKIDLTVLSESGGGARRDVSLALCFDLLPGSIAFPRGRLIVQPWSDEFVKRRQREDAEDRNPDAAANTALTQAPSPKPTPDTATPHHR